jgi:hypothetical protein
MALPGQVTAKRLALPPFATHCARCRCCLVRDESSSDPSCLFARMAHASQPWAEVLMRMCVTRWVVTIKLPRAADKRNQPTSWPAARTCLLFACNTGKRAYPAGCHPRNCPLLCHLRRVSVVTAIATHLRGASIRWFLHQSPSHTAKLAALPLRPELDPALDHGVHLLGHDAPWAYHGANKPRKAVSACWPCTPPSPPCIGSHAVHGGACCMCSCHTPGPHLCELLQHPARIL